MKFSKTAKYGSTLFAAIGLIFGIAGMILYWRFNSRLTFVLLFPLAYINALFYMIIKTKAIDDMRKKIFCSITGILGITFLFGSFFVKEYFQDGMAADMVRMIGYICMTAHELTYFK